MNVLYDYQAFDMQTHGGVSRCFAELYRHLPDYVHANFGICETDNVYLQQMGFRPNGYTYKHFISQRDFKWKKGLFKAYYNLKYGHPEKWDKRPILNQLKTEFMLKAGKFDVFHPTFFDSYFLNYIGNKPFVITVHDMIPELYPQYYARDDIQIRQKNQVIPRATHIVAVSEQTKKDLVRMMHIPEEKVTVVYHGADSSPYVPSEQRAFNFEYILYVGERHFYKNFDVFTKDCIPILKRHKELKVVCTGKPFDYDEQAMLEGYGIADRFVYRFMETNQEFLDLYHNAVAFVYPSDYEGFGIPILEAWKADCPVMLNRASCFPEIAGDAAIYFQVKDGSSDFEEQFETLYHMDSNERSRFIDVQRSRLQRYSWESSAQKLAEVYKTVVK